MGCDIHSIAEVKQDTRWELVEERIFPTYSNAFTSSPFDWRSYRIFAFLAGVRNYSQVQPLSEPKGLPVDSEYLNTLEAGAFSYYSEQESSSIRKQIIQDPDLHSASFFTLNELLNYNYEREFFDVRSEVKTTVREFLGQSFFNELQILSTLGEPEDVRIVFWFDN
jgi:hypothetical protein